MSLAATTRYLWSVATETLRLADLADDTITTWVLIGQLPADDDGWNYRTSAVKTIRAISSATGEIEAFLDEAFGAWPLKKASDAQAFASTILVGRASTNDVCLQHQSISKLHARLRLVGDDVVASDAGSSNGTIVNGLALKEGEELTLKSGDLVRFGECALQLFAPEHLRRLLRTLRS